MRLPYLRPSGKYGAVSEVLGGLALTDEYVSGALGGGRRLDFCSSPGIGQRKPPKKLMDCPAPQGIFSDLGTAIIYGGRVYFDGKDIGEVSQGPKLMAAMGGRIIIMPDKKYIDERTGELKDMEVSVTIRNASFSGGVITCQSAQWPFNAGDGVEISGCAVNKGNNMTVIVRQVESGRLIFDDNAFYSGLEPGDVVIKRKIPDLEVMCERDNRLWGCAGDTIYSSKLGDPLNFFVYDGLATDSYALKVGSAGSFTACGQYGSHIIFFKENMAYKLYGTRPANYQLMASRIPGVRKGCGGSLWVDSEDMYYLGPGGVYAYSGGVPALLSFELGDIRADSAVGMVWNGKYYLSVKEGVRGYTLIYDILRGRWLPWGDETAAGMAGSGDGGMLMLEESGQLLAVDEGEGDEEWYAEFRAFKDGQNRHMDVMSLIIDARPEEGAWLAVDINTGGHYRQAALFDSSVSGIRAVAIPPNRTGGLKVRLRGCGRCPVYSIERTFRSGSEAR